tara:strand:- start:110 stop:277 length:168 start_codon:yes stop_codon:yes gene_type:complete
MITPEILTAKIKLMTLLNKEFAKLDMNTSTDDRDVINIKIDTILSCIDVLDESKI